MAQKLYKFQKYFSVWLAVNGKPVLFWKGINFQFEISLLSILCMLIAQMEMGTSRVSGDSDNIT